MSVTRGELLRHCERCDRESTYLINFLSPDNVPEMICWGCVREEDQRGMGHSPLWARQRRAAGRIY